MDFKTDEIVSLLKEQLQNYNADIDVAEVGEITYVGDGVARVSGLENVISPAGAAGFWQLLKGTAKEYDIEVNSSIDERYHLEKSTQVACDYLNKAFDKFGSWTMAAASYNMGQNGAIRSISQQSTNNYYNLYLSLCYKIRLFFLLKKFLIMRYYDLQHVSILLNLNLCHK